MKQLLFILGCGLCFYSQAATLTVTSTADNMTSNDGQCTLREAIAFANINLQNVECPRSGDTGNYDDEIIFDVGDSQIDLSLGKINITDNLTISGSDTQSIILDGGRNTPTNGTHRNGDAGMFDVSANLTLNYLQIQNQMNANSDGGAVHMTGQILSINHAVFKGNASDTFDGGAIHMAGGSGTQLSISDSSLSHNKSLSGAGAVNSNADEAHITRSHFVSNNARNVGAVYARNLTLSDSLFKGNMASRATGALYLRLSGTVSNTQFTDNTAGQGGAGAMYAYIYDNNLHVDNSTFASNSATTSGGALRVDRSSTGIGMATLTNSTFYDNTADEGGAIWAEGQMAIQSITAVDNQADTAGGFIYFDGGSANLTLNGSLLLGNGLDGSIQDCSGDYPYMLYSGYNLLSADVMGDNTCGLISSINPTTTLDATVILSNLGDNGCLIPLGSPAYQQCVLTMRPYLGSVAIDAGDIGGLSTDQRGFPRVLGVAADAGAVEMGLLTLTITPPVDGSISAASTPLAQSGNIDACRDTNSSDCQADYLSGDYITLTATPDTGFVFTTWEGNCNSTTNSVTVLMDDAKTCSATFTPLTYTLGGTITGLAAGQSVTLADGNGQIQVFSTSLFQFDNELVYGDSYTVFIRHQPSGQTCEMTNGSGTITADVSDIIVTCTNDATLGVIFSDSFEQ